ncbi:MAG: hypothetical protein DI586_09300, partial [Micavibrio aeruginosavorus]
ESETNDHDTLDADGKNRVMFALISHGVDRAGAWQPDGTATSCNTSGLDVANCNSSSLTATLRGRSKSEDITIKDPEDATGASETVATLKTPSKSYSTPFGTNHYDDTIIYRATSRDEGWASLRNNITDETAGTYLSEDAQVIVKKNPSDDISPVASMDVDGSVKVYKTESPTVCDRLDVDANTDRCFKIKNIAAKEPLPNELEGGKDKAIKCNDMIALKKFIKEGDKSDKTSLYIKRDCPTTEAPATMVKTCTGGQGVSGLVGGVPQCS